jgi:serine-type D-Ala-D-Ala carboxypeptidase (penicillin-binding protein 5/6)
VTSWQQNGPPRATAWPTAGVLARLLAAGAAAGLILPAAALPAQARTGRGPALGGPQLASRGVVVNYPLRRGRRLPSVPAAAYVIADADTGVVLAAKDPHGHFWPASTLKILTADTLLPVLDPAATVVASPLAAEVQPVKIGLVAGRRYRVADLFRAMLLVSANDAAIVLAQATGSYHQGVAMMNAEAKHLQADDTVARRPNGLNAPGQHSSAYDLALMARQALAIPALMRIEAMRTAVFPLGPRSSITLYNQVTMLGRYPGDLGGKIGWTTASETTFIGWARRDGRTLIVTLMHCVPLTEMTYAAKLLNWGFAMDGRVAPVGVLVPPRPGPGPGLPRPARPGHRHRLAAVRPAAVRLTAPSAAGGISSAALAAGAGVLLALLIAGGLVVLVRREPAAGSPPGR